MHPGIPRVNGQVRAQKEAKWDEDRGKAGGF